MLAQCLVRRELFPGSDFLKVGMLTVYPLLLLTTVSSLGQRTHSYTDEGVSRSSKYRLRLDLNTLTPKPFLMRN